MFSSWKKRKLRKGLSGLRKNLKYIAHVNDDVYAKATKNKIDEFISDIDNIKPENSAEVEKLLADAPAIVGSIMPRQSFPVMREYADILAVALCVAFGIRALFLQPFKIPTSSMQPTLFGIHYIADKNTLPHLPGLLHYALFSTQRAKLTIREDGRLEPGSGREFNKFMLFPWTRFIIGSVEYQLPGAARKVESYALKGHTVYDAGEKVCDGWLSLGDHLFVDRYTFHLREPKRGDVIVFNTEGITYHNRKLAEHGYYYIKRLIGLPGDTIRIKDNMVYIKPEGYDEEKPITDFSPELKKVYSGHGGFHGHLNMPNSEYLTTPDETFTVPEDCYFALGDNSIASSDSRFWGVLPRKNLVGRAIFVFWPISRRWGFVDRAEPLDVETSEDFSSMHLQ